MSSDDLTKQAPTDDRIDELISLAHTFAGQLKAVQDDVKSLNDKVDARLHDSRPIWEAVQSQIAEARTEIAEMRTEMESGFHTIERRLDVVSIDINKVRADLRFLENRVDKLEEKAS